MRGGEGKKKAKVGQKEDMIMERSAEPEISVLRDTSNMQVIVDVCPTSFISASPVSMLQIMIVQSSDELANLCAVSATELAFERCFYSPIYTLKVSMCIIKRAQALDSAEGEETRLKCMMETANRRAIISPRT